MSTDKCPSCGGRLEWYGTPRVLSGFGQNGYCTKCGGWIHASRKEMETGQACMAAMHRIRELEQIIENVVELLEAQACPKHMDAAKKMPFSDFAEEEKRIGCSRCMVERIRELEARCEALQESGMRMGFLEVRHGRNRSA